MMGGRGMIDTEIDSKTHTQRDTRQDAPKDRIASFTQTVSAKRTTTDENR